MINRREFLGAGAASLAAPNATQVARMDSDGMLVINGRREFILGTYQRPNIPQPLKALKAAGFNLVRTGAGVAELDQVREAGMWAWTSVGSVSPKARQESETKIRKLVESLKAHPALLLWETEDEPTFVWKKPREVRVASEQIIETYQLIKRLDPARLHYLNHSPTNLVPTLARYNPGTDAVATDIYPVIPRGIRESYALWPDGQQGDYLNEQISQVGDYTRKMRRVAGPARAVFMVLQAFAWENFRKERKNPAMVVYPTRAQTRFMAYQAVANGANGIIYFGFGQNGPGEPVWEDIRSVAGELGTLREALAARAATIPVRVEYHETGHSLDRGLEWIAKPHRGGIALIVVNADKNPVEATLGGLAGFGAAEALFEARKPEIINGALRDAFEPFGVRVYRLAAK